MSELKLEEVFSALAYSARPRVVDWDALHQQLQHLSPLSDSDRVSMLLAAANTGQLSAAQWSALIGLPASKGADQSVVPLPEVASWLRSHLDTVVTGPRARINRLREEAAAAITGRIVLAPVMTKRGRRDHVVIADGIRGALFFAMLIVIESHLEGRHHVCRCRFSKCGQFFLKRFQSGAGAPARKYCSDEEHARLGDREQAQQRMAKLRRRAGVNKRRETT